jgi:hypothetical protein
MDSDGQEAEAASSAQPDNSKRNKRAPGRQKKPTDEKRDISFRASINSHELDVLKSMFFNQAFIDILVDSGCMEKRTAKKYSVILKNGGVSAAAAAAETIDEGAETAGGKGTKKEKKETYAWAASVFRYFLTDHFKPWFDTLLKSRTGNESMVRFQLMCATNQNRALKQQVEAMVEQMNDLRAELGRDVLSVEQACGTWVNESPYGASAAEASAAFGIPARGDTVTIPAPPAECLMAEPAASHPGDNRGDEGHPGDNRGDEGESHEGESHVPEVTRARPSVGM